MRLQSDLVDPGEPLSDSELAIERGDEDEEDEDEEEDESSTVQGSVDEEDEDAPSPGVTTGTSSLPVVAAVGIVATRFLDYEFAVDTKCDVISVIIVEFSLGTLSSS